MRRIALILGLASALAATGSAAAADCPPTLSAVEGEVICPTCNTTLDLSNAPVADRMRSFIRQRIAAGDCKAQIKARLVDEFGPSVLAAPPREGFDLVAWLLPLAGLLGGAAVVGFLAVRWAARRDRPGAGGPSANGAAPLGPELERRVDEELARFE